MSDRKPNSTDRAALAQGITQEVSLKKHPKRWCVVIKKRHVGTITEVCRVRQDAAFRAAKKEVRAVTRMKQFDGLRRKRRK